MIVGSGHDDMVRCRGVARTFGHGESAVVALHEVSCAVRAGDRIAITGTSGSGKSTLLHLMAGLEKPTAGTVSWPMTGSPRGCPGRVGLVFQGRSLLAPLDVRDNVALPLHLAGVGDEQAMREADRALAAMGVADLAGKYPDELSGGQEQRVAVARVVASRPRLILADEPTGRLDRSHAQVVVAVLIAAAAELDSALVVSTHDPLVAAELSTRWRLRDGRLTTPAAPVWQLGVRT